ncbi:S-layer homology domain-containing protein [Brevibacillus laterosporus]|uniref:S-layer homology domain-containing protein n=1 Tax=Brevibacillus laterosporus TaxID=1465 RepID=UPI00036B6F9C|nr:S-layer homology domain-containing protein [Brevibacillus laterosporus]ATO51375.1 glycoside hydrolase family 18 [Brevibacillus laterosporus DSM 25]MBG9801193.1 glycoside hydrolase family 18 [Brevibacillus laterosporus]MED2002712.1 S-layer homology domain-containing protein [Brevibacillus laterosporus]MED4765074.1 S-layer homology domain-containing protein [Brevibacillus laterosporus]PPA86641.1 S-layer homology domain-containing protein [Brevibacillus laterosporus]
MTQQNSFHSEDYIYKKRLFYDNGIRFTEVKAKLINDYKPPSPSLKTHVNQTLSSSAGLISHGTSHYTTTLTLLFYSKKEFADWLQFSGAKHRYYDEKGTIYVGILTGEPDINTAEMETKYIVTIGLSLIRKQEHEYRYINQFIDMEKHWAKTYVDEMQQRGLIANYEDEGEAVSYFRPDKVCTRAEGITFLMRTYRHIDRILRGY